MGHFLRRAQKMPAPADAKQQAEHAACCEKGCVLFQDAVPDHDVCKHDGNHRQQLNQDVDGRACRILEWIADRVADNRRFVLDTALAAIFAAFNVLFRVVLCAAGIGHFNCQQEAGNRRARQQRADAVDA